MPYKNKEDQRASWRRHYENNRVEIRTDIKDRRVETREYIASIRAQSECVDCGNSDPRVLDFDHLPGHEKVTDLAKAAAKGWSRKRIDAEIAKCEVVCANCHRIRSWQRRNDGVRAGAQAGL